MKGITLWQKYANFWQIISKKIREMGSYLITYCSNPRSFHSQTMVNTRSTPWSTPEATSVTHA
jgi:hypothetical protein